MPVCLIMEEAQFTNDCNMHIKQHITMGSLQADKLKTGTLSNAVHLHIQMAGCFLLKQTEPVVTVWVECPARQLKTSTVALLHFVDAF